MKGKEEKMFKVYRTTEDLEGDYKGLNVGKIFENEELAREYLDDSIPGIRACRFYQSIDFETIDNSSPRILNLKSEIEAIKKKQDEFNSKEYLQTITAAKHTCSSCGSAINRKAFLATRSGSITNFCPVCGDIKQEIIDALGHDYSNEWTIDVMPTDTSDGYKSHHCIRCDAKKDITAISKNKIVTCEEEKNSANWIWSEVKKACVYKVSNTSAK